MAGEKKRENCVDLDLDTSNRSRSINTATTAVSPTDFNHRQRSQLLMNDKELIQDQLTMHSILNKIKNSVGSPEFAEETSAKCLQDQEERALSDDHDLLCGDISGTLTFSDESMASPTDTQSEFLFEVPHGGSSTFVNNITFEVISAEVIRDGRSGFVNYTILINPHEDQPRSAQTVVIRRYSDFEMLHQRLKKRFPAILSTISFPRKILTGNFTSQTIAKRSTAFEQYLAHLFSYFEVRYCQDFMEFFVLDNFTEAIQCFVDKNFPAAVSLFQKTLPILEKLYGGFHPYVYQCLCATTVCYINMEKLKLAQTCSEVAVKCLLEAGSSADDEFRVSLLLTAIRLCWSLGIEKEDLEKELLSLKEKGINVNTVRDLQDILRDTFLMRFSGRGKE